MNANSNSEIKPVNVIFFLRDESGLVLVHGDPCDDEESTVPVFLPLAA